MLCTCRKLSWLFVTIPALSVATAPRSGALDAVTVVTIADCGGPKATFNFDDKVVVSSKPPWQLPGEPPPVPYPRLSGTRTTSFTTEFCREVSNVKQWYVRHNWGPSPAEPAELQIDVSDRYKISGALVNMAIGDTGRLDFPAPEVAIGQAAIAHELTHVYLPNGNRMLAEGLAVYVQHKIGSKPAFPNFGRPLDELVREFTCGMHLVGVPKPGLENISFEDADKIATPSPVTLRIGLIPYGDTMSAYVYPIIGSFVEFLITSHGMEKFRALYNLTPLDPNKKRNEGSPERWASVYGITLAGLEKSWRSHIATLKCPR
jgi:hypothetical protein